MVDHLSKAGRSRNMAAIRSKNTGPELALRAALRRAGATGYRVHSKGLPSRPDVVFPRWKVAVFVDGAFWHGHPDHFNPACATQYWRDKIARTQERDRLANEALRAEGWTVVRLWDFELAEAGEKMVGRVLHALRESGWHPPTRHNPGATHVIQV